MSVVPSSAELLNQDGRERLEIVCFGGFSVRRGGSNLLESTSKSNKMWLVFKYLLTHRNQTVPRDVLLETFWANGGSDDPEHALHSCIYRLRRMLEPGLSKYTSSNYITIAEGTYSFNPNSDYWLDAEQFEESCLRARVEAANEPEKAAEIYQRALALYKGDYLTEHLYDDWVKPAQKHYRRIYRQAILEYVDLLKRFQQYNEARRACEEALALEPMDEEIHMTLLELMLASGNLREARSYYEHVSALFYRENGVSPSPRMRDIYRQIKVNEEKYPVMDLDVVCKALNRIPSENGATFCETDAFRLLYQIERRRMERSGRPVTLAGLLLTGEDYALPSSKDLKQANSHLEKVLKKNLRKGDIVCHWNEVQFLLMLPGVPSETAMSILQRLSDRFQRLHSGSSVKLRVRHLQLVPEKHQQR